MGESPYEPGRPDGSIPPSDPDDALSALAGLQAGVPVLVWLNTDPVAPAWGLRDYSGRVSGKPFSGRSALPSLARRIADLRADITAPDRHLTLIWDDPRPLCEPAGSGQEPLPADYLADPSSALADDGPPPEHTASKALSAEEAAAIFLQAVADPGLSTGDRHQALPPYAVRPYQAGQCCLSRSPAPHQLEAGQTDAVTAAFLRCASQLTPLAIRLTVTFTNERQLQGYRAGLLHLVDALLTFVLRMLVILLSAVAHQATVSIFLLIILRSIRHYGHRGEPDHVKNPACALRTHQSRGSVRLAA